MILVVDASVAAKWFVLEDQHEHALRVLDSGHHLIAPDLVVPEVANVLFKKVVGSEIGEEQAILAVDQVASFFHRLIPSTQLSREAFLLAMKLNHSVCDCLYLACATVLGAFFLTADKRFCRKATKHGFGDIAFDLTNLQHVLARHDIVEEAKLAEIDRLHALVVQTFEFVRRKISTPLGEESKVQVYRSTDLQPAFDSPNYRRLTNYLSELPRTDLEAIVALAWFGRGADSGDYQELTSRASLLLGEHPQRHFRYVVSLLSYVPSGYARLKRESERKQAPRRR